MSSWRVSRKGFRPLARQVPKRDDRVILLSLPCSERVPPLIFRLITRWRRLRSAALLSDGASGCDTKTNNSPYQVRGRLLMCRSIRRQSLACTANGSSRKGRHSASNRSSSANCPRDSGRPRPPPMPGLWRKAVALPMPTGPARRLPGTGPSARECPAAEPAPDPDRGWAQHLCLSPG